MSKNKLDQHARRQINQFVKEQFFVLNQVVKPRPKWVPVKIWQFGARIFLDTNLLSDYLANGIGANSKR